MEKTGNIEGKAPDPRCGRFFASYAQAPVWGLCSVAAAQEEGARKGCPYRLYGYPSRVSILYKVGFWEGK